MDFDDILVSYIGRGLSSSLIKVYLGDDRFILISSHLRHWFPGRTTRDLKAKYHEFRRQGLNNGVLDLFPWL